jgi:pyruvate/2-oxoglutarate dehydrogenase complex dihydrolipoamide acyltransferase (E2) component
MIQKQKETKLTLTHFALKAVSQLLVKQPDLNGKLAFGKVLLG